MVTVVVAIFFAGMGVYGLVAPEKLVAPFGMRVTSADGRSEVRAVYGGFGLATAAALTPAALDAGTLRDGVLVAMALALGGMALGRAVAMLLERPSRCYPTGFYLVVETGLMTAHRSPFLIMFVRAGVAG
ncbi:DUF4345 family protein [Herbidospora sp. NBRC 101105]|uniref:DUF4345 family protein n=1 Tax=Herbidospora sp. NBRC 101105 TaxID=3032195 RepID=UPI0024A59DB2|nr:DUF4345 family protein [Herbidospora sp. NBRC 101105]GLX99412.1 membrane protein [Herbidospora sp. NBRC 101105]